MGVKAFELIVAADFGKMVTYKNNTVSSVQITEAIKETNLVSKANYLVHIAKSLGISFGE